LPLSDFQKTKLGQNWALVSVISRGLCELYAKTRSETILYPAYKDSLCPTITCHVQPNYTTNEIGGGMIQKNKRLNRQEKSCSVY